MFPDTDSLADPFAIAAFGLSGVEAVSPDMVRKASTHGRPAGVAAQIRPFVTADTNLHLIAEVAPLLIPVDPAETIEASAEICRLVKAT
jgi:phthiodiolone/phenolphthiodiolone dimycocerosates ketoreductase